jgi:hypothetical protein
MLIFSVVCDLELLDWKKKKWRTLTRKQAKIDCVYPLSSRSKGVPFLNEVKPHSLKNHAKSCKNLLNTSSCIKYSKMCAKAGVIMHSHSLPVTITEEYRWNFLKSSAMVLKPRKSLSKGQHLRSCAAWQHGTEWRQISRYKEKCEQGLIPTAHSCN